MKIQLKRSVFSRENRCKICGTTRNLQIDHIIPVSRGGSDALGNLRVLCSGCNLKKGQKTDFEWRNF